MDLRTGFPRSVRVRLSGYVHLARMVDKCRAKLAGTLGEYIYPCPMDQRLLDFAGIDAGQVLDRIPGQSDDSMAAWWTATATSRSDAEREAWNDAMLARGPDSDEKWSYFRDVRDRIDASRSDITSWADLLDLEEGRPVPLRNSGAGSSTR